MACLFPSTVRVFHKGVYEYIEVPCRKCLNCRIQRQTDMEFSCMLATQQAYSRNLGCSFITLTYRDDSVPLRANPKTFVSGSPEMNMSLCYDDYQKFIKRLREHTKRTFGFDFQILGCGEYGDSSQFTHRPHYHLVAFGLDSVIANNLCRKTWKYGIVDVGALRPGGIRYLVDYVMKQNDKEYSSLYDDIGIERPFLHHSIKLGNDYFLNDFPYTQNFRYFHKGKSAIIPATYRKKIDPLRQFEYFDSQGRIEASKVGLSYPCWQALQSVCRAENYVIQSRSKGRACYAVPPAIVDYVSNLVPCHIVFPNREDFSDTPSGYSSYFSEYQRCYKLKYGELKPIVSWSEFYKKFNIKSYY